MSKTLKQMMTGELKEAFRGLRDFLLVDYKGLTAEESGALREALEQKQMKMRVVKNSVFLHAMRELGHFQDVPKFDGPVAVIFGEGQECIALARTVEGWNKKNKKVTVKGGVLDGQEGGADEAKTWAKLPSKPEMLSQLLGSLIGPATGIASLWQNTLTAFPGLVGAHIQKREKEE
jgi:large subunit ribosomal protein L10